jgi:signal transduction histidine kinase
MIMRLDKSFESEKRFSSDVSHELRTPVSVISAQCEYTLEKPREVEEYEEALKVISRQTDKMGKMISDMLDFTRLETKSDRYAKTDVNFSELVELACIDFSRIKQKNITLESSIEDGVMVTGNYELLQRLVNNLISNAFRYGRENGQTRVSLTSDKDRIYLRVADNGIGIKPEDIDKIFDRFYQADSSRTSGGTGLGLALAREIAEFHSGKLTASSRFGEGSEFTFEMKKIKE